MKDLKQDEDAPLLEDDGRPKPNERTLARLPRQTLIYVAVCALLALQNSSYTLLRRYGHGVLKEAASSQSILAVGEIMKATFCMYMVVRSRASREVKETGEVETREEPPTSIPAIAKRLALTSAPMAVPAIIFLAMNLLSFVALHRISASAFTLIQQSKLIATAVLSRVVLSKELSLARWRALGILLCAVLIICFETRPNRDQNCHDPSDSTQITSSATSESAALRAAEYVVGVSAVSLEAILSGFSNVYFERVLKSTSLSVWERNVQLAGYSLCIYLPMALWEHSSLLYGWSGLTWIVAFLGALGGILIGLVISYMDSITKNLALSVAIVLTACVDHLCFDGPMTLNIISAATIIIIAIVTYTSG
mmetsp:Transcript_45428/g.119320  ORF Transcript_45428/g.119320 Transcript_45428/m.119320 type:complete len:366 (+) Transcript_45428:99-1196(+)